MSSLEPTPRTTLKRHRERGSHERATIHAILDEGFLCHLAFVQDGSPHVIPTAYGRRGDTLYVHGSSANRALRALGDGGQACVSVTLLDGLVLGRSAFHTSMNYRSVILYGPTRVVSEPDEKSEALRAIVEHVLPGRWKDVREPSPEEVQRTLVLALPLEEGSAKIRTGPPIDEEEDYALDCWAGVIPVSLATGAPIDDPRLKPGTEVPAYASDYRRPTG
jgi:nitroimidazol reductase NimA-like FMN-containing flavoprotein (pyridoxamine 5'-phosphate oxidase superfamily)